MVKTLRESFKNVFTYSAGMEDWCKKAYQGGELEYTFVSDFAIADWYGAKDVKETYNRVIKEWGKDYKAMTEIVVALNLLSWAHNQLREQGIGCRDEFIELYSNLYYMAKDFFYDTFKDNEKAQHYFFEMTD